MVRVERERLAIEALGVLERTRLVAQPSEVDPRRDVVESASSTLAVGELGFAVRADLLALERGLEELVGVLGGAQARACTESRASGATFSPSSRT